MDERARSRLLIASLLIGAAIVAVTLLLTNSAREGTPEYTFAMVVVSVVVILWTILFLWWYLPKARSRGRERTEQRARYGAAHPSYPPTDPRFEPGRYGWGGGTTPQEYAAHLVSVHASDLQRLGIDRNQIRLAKPWLRDVHSMCHHGQGFGS